MYRKCYTWFLKSEQKRHICSGGLDLLVGMVGIEEENDSDADLDPDADLDSDADLDPDAALTPQKGELVFSFSNFSIFFFIKIKCSVDL